MQPEHSNRKKEISNPNFNSFPWSISDASLMPPIYVGVLQEKKGEEIQRFPKRGIVHIYYRKILYHCQKD
jgi:hypothetical protein